MEQLILNVVLPIVLGIASTLLVGKKRLGIALAIGLIVGVSVFIAVQFVPDTRTAGVTWCERETKAEVRGHVVTYFLKAPTAGEKIQVKVYEDGHGDPPLAGPVFATSDATGTFVAVFEKAPQTASGRVVLNTVTFWTPILFGEKWAKYDFRDGSAQACR